MTTLHKAVGLELTVWSLMPPSSVNSHLSGLQYSLLKKPRPISGLIFSYESEVFPHIMISIKHCSYKGEHPKA